MNSFGRIQIWLMVAVAVCLFGLPKASMAVQEPPAQLEGKPLLDELSAEQIGERASALIKTINSEAARIAKYLKMMNDASPEDQEVLELQIWKSQERVAADIYQLGNVLIALEKKTPQAQLRRQVVEIFVFALSRFKFHSDYLRKQIDRKRADRPASAVDELYALEAQIAKYTSHLDTVFELYLRHIQQMARLGSDVKAPNNNLAHLLIGRADELSGRLTLSLNRISSLEKQREELPEDADTIKLLMAAAKSMDTNAESLEATLDLMDELSLETERMRGQLLLVTRDYSSSLLKTGVAVDLARRTLDGVTKWIRDNGLKYFLKFLLFAGIILVFRLVKRFVRKGLHKALETSRLNLSQLVRRMVVNTASNLVMILGVMLALSQLGITLGPLLAGLGVAGFIVGFALQDSLGNFASGLMILLYRPYDIGDLVEVGGVLGNVDKMSLVSTSLLTFDNQQIVIPNSKIWGDVIKNLTAQTIRRVDMVFGIAYSDDIPKTERILAEILQTHDRVLDHPGPMIKVHSLGASSVDFIVRPWVKVEDYWDVYWDVTRSVKLRFDEEGVSIPFPQHDVHVYQEHQTQPAAVDSTV